MMKVQLEFVIVKLPLLQKKYLIRSKLGLIFAYLKYKVLM